MVYQYKNESGVVEFTDRPRGEKPVKKIKIKTETAMQKWQRQFRLGQIRRLNQQIDQRNALRLRLEREEKLRRLREAQLQQTRQQLQQSQLKKQSRKQSQVHVHHLPHHTHHRDHDNHKQHHSHHRDHERHPPQRPVHRPLPTTDRSGLARRMEDPLYPASMNIPPALKTGVLSPASMNLYR